MFQELYIRKIFALLLVAGVVALLSYTHLTLKEAQYISGNDGTISVSGEGEVMARPDVAVFSFGVLAEEDDATAAQNKSAEAINAITEYLKNEGVEDKDIKNQNYSLTPRYDYIRTDCTLGGYCPSGERVLRGYEVNQTIQVKVRDTDTAGILISGVGGLGATNISGLQFTIDDEDEFLIEARRLAIEDAKTKASRLADELGVKLVRITNFNEGGGARGGSVMFESKMMAFDTEDSSIAPEIPMGENTFTSNVNITYEIR